MKQSLVDVFDLDIALKMTRGLSQSCGVPCQLYNSQGFILFRETLNFNSCYHCKKSLLKSGECTRNPVYNIGAAMRFGGRYIYSCNTGMGWVSVPIVANGNVVAALECGPVMLMDIEDYLAGSDDMGSYIKTDEMTIEEVLMEFPKKSPSEMNSISLQAAATSMYIGGSGRQLLEINPFFQQQNDIGTYIQKLKSEMVDFDYPIEIECRLLRMVADGDTKQAEKLALRLIANIVYLSGNDPQYIQSRIGEIITLASRAAIEGGADLIRVLGIKERICTEISSAEKTERACSFLIDAVKTFSSIVYDHRIMPNKMIIYKAINYMEENLSSKITLEEVASYVGFSGSHFSRMFKKNTGETFNSYLIKMRIEEGKFLLLASSLNVRDICLQVGFESQSYFIDVFRKSVGVTPGKYRESQKRVDHLKEFDSMMKQ